jgi:hypothetical protein
MAALALWDDEGGVTVTVAAAVPVPPLAFTVTLAEPVAST